MLAAPGTTTANRSAIAARLAAQLGAERASTAKNRPDLRTERTFGD
jgi:hypothetical protein